MKAQKCQVTVQEQAGKPFWGHNFSGTVDDSQPDLDDRYIPIQRVLAGQRGDVMGQVEGSHLAHMTGDLSIQNVAGSARYYALHLLINNLP